ncbi:2-deoxystreptamine glucosyltransferase [bacterium BMS3Bbin13]|nr:2-deoxystreptamine glucosyltransferase [bacterium BMS3Bbin13]
MPDRPLTVLQLLPALHGGGVERGTLEVAAELVRRGHRALVVSAGGRLVEALTAAGAEHYEWPIGVKSPGTLRWVPRLRRLLQRERVDILHVRSRLPAWIGWLAWRGMDPRTRPRFVTTVHGLYSVNAYSAVMTRGEAVIAISQAVQEYIRRHYPEVPSERVWVIHRGVDRSYYSYGFRPDSEWLDVWHRRYPHLKDHFLITLPARITGWKGHRDFITVIGALCDRGIPVHGLAVGEAPRRKRRYLEELRSRIRSAGLEDQITFIGHRRDLREVMAVSDVVLSLSADPEAFGRTTLESLSIGRPVAGYDHGGVGEQLRTILPAGRVPPRDVDSMVALLVRWYECPPTVPAEHPFTLGSMLEKTMEVYRQLMDERVHTR